MVREDKVQVVKDLEELFKSANALVLAEYRGLTVTQQTKLRRELKNAGASFNVVKMSLAKRAAENIGLDSLNEYFAGPTGVAVIESDPVEAAKVIKEFSKENEAFVKKYLSRLSVSLHTLMHMLPIFEVVRVSRSTVFS